MKRIQEAAHDLYRPKWITRYKTYPVYPFCAIKVVCCFLFIIACLLVKGLDPFPVLALDPIHCFRSHVINYSLYLYARKFLG